MKSMGFGIILAVYNLRKVQVQAMNRRGVTLIELVTVLVIIAILAALSVPSFGTWMAHYRLRSAARDVVTAMRTAQMRAVSYNMRHGVAFDSANNQYRLYRDSGGLLEDGAATSLPKGITYNSISNLLTDGPGGLPFISFFPNSTSSAVGTGTIVLRNSKGRDKTIRILQASGRVTIE
jgi:prepilin-type N-terminal cleavage/methylation domain-containing protein